MSVGDQQVHPFFSQRRKVNSHKSTPADVVTDNQGALGCPDPANSDDQEAGAEDAVGRNGQDRSMQTGGVVEAAQVSNGIRATADDRRSGA